MTTDNKTRDEKLEDSIMGDGTNYKPYSVGRTRRLRRLGNPMFGGEPENLDDWDLERRLGTAWVMFTSDFGEIDRIMGMDDPLAEMERIFDDCHHSEMEKLYEWIMRESGRTAAAQTEAIKERGGKSQLDGEGTSHTG